MVNLTKQPQPSETQQTPPEAKDNKYQYDRQQKAYFITINNPETYNYSKETVIDVIHQKFKNVVYWCMCDEQGSCYHTHIYILLSKKKRWSSVQRAFPHAHIESKVHGSPQECRAYIRKEGKKYSDKAETNFPETFYEEGSIPEFFISENRTEMFLQIDNLLDAGWKPEAIMEKSLAFRQFETLIRKQYLNRRFTETPPIRDIVVRYHLGASASGKSYSYVLLCEQVGIEQVFYASDFSNNCTALLDNYEAQEYLFIDEVKPDSFKYGYLLQLLQGYRTPIHARYNNVYSLWKQVEITSIYTPYELFSGMDIQNRSTDSLYQLMRRITAFVYHWKTDDGEYHSYEIPSAEYVSLEDLQKRAESSLNFTPLDCESPFDEPEKGGAALHG